MDVLNLIPDVLREPFEKKFIKPLQNERDEARISRCREGLEERGRILREREDVLMALRAAEAKAADEEKRLSQALQMARRKRINAEYARRAANWDFASRLSRLEAQWRSDAPEEIGQFIYEMWKADDETRRKLNFEQRPGSPNRLTGEVKNLVVVSNQRAIEVRCNYIKAAIAEARGMMFKALNYHDMVARLNELRAGIPDGLRLETVKVAKPDVSELRR